MNVQTTMASLLQSSVKELGSVSSIIESPSVVDAQKVIADLVTKLQDFPSMITQTVGSLSSRVSNFVKSLPSTLLSSLPFGLGSLPSLVSTLPSQLSSLIPGLPSQLSSLIPGLPSQLSSLIPGLPSQLSSLIPGLPSQLSSLIPGLPSQLSSLIPGLPSQLSSLIPGLPSQLSSLIPGLPSGSVSLQVWQPWPSPYLLPFFHLYLPVLDHYPHW